MRGWTAEKTPGYVLLVDDIADQREIYAAILRHEGFCVLAAGDGATALHLAAAHQPDVVLLDLGLPGLNGIEVARQLRSDRRTRDTRVLMLTAHATHELRHAAQDAGCDEYLVKPVSPRDVLAAVRRHVGERQQPSARHAAA